MLYDQELYFFIAEGRGVAADINPAWRKIYLGWFLSGLLQIYTLLFL